MNEMHLVIGSIVAMVVLIISMIDLYEVTHSD